MAKQENRPGAIAFPNQQLLAVFHGAGAEDAAHELRDLGCSEDDVRILRGQEAIDSIVVTGKSKGPITQLLKGIQDHLSDEQTFMEQYENEARAGNTILVARVPEERADEARQLVARNGGQTIRYFGALAVKDYPRSASTPELQPGEHAAIDAAEARRRPAANRASGLDTPAGPLTQRTVRRAKKARSARK